MEGRGGLGALAEGRKRVRESEGEGSLVLQEGNYGWKLIISLHLQMAPKAKKATSDNINSKLQLVIKSGKVVSVSCIFVGPT